MGKVHVKPAIVILFAILLFSSGCTHFQEEMPPTAAEDKLELVIAFTGYNWVAMRYNKVTGEAWFQFPYYWRTIGEKETLAKSEY